MHRTVGQCGMNIVSTYPFLLYEPKICIIKWWLCKQWWVFYTPKFSKLGCNQHCSISATCYVRWVYKSVPVHYYTLLWKNCSLYFCMTDRIILSNVSPLWKAWVLPEMASTQWQLLLDRIIHLWKGSLCVVFLQSDMTKICITKSKCLGTWHIIQSVSNSKSKLTMKLCIYVILKYSTYTKVKRYRKLLKRSTTGMGVNVICFFFEIFEEKCHKLFNVNSRLIFWQGFLADVGRVNRNMVQNYKR